MPPNFYINPPFQIYLPFLAKNFVPLPPQVTQFSEGPTPPLTTVEWGGGSNYGYARSILEIQVDYLDKSDIPNFVPKFNDTIYYKGTLQIHHLKRVGKSKVNFYYNSTYKKSSSLLRAVDYVLASFPDSDLEEIDKPSENEKDEPFTEAVDQYDAFEVTIGNKY